MKVKVSKSYSKPTSESMKDYKKGRDWFSMVKKIRFKRSYTYKRSKIHKSRKRISWKRNKVYMWNRWSYIFYCSFLHTPKPCIF